MQLERNGKLVNKITKKKTNYIISIDHRDISIKDFAFENLSIYVGKLLSKDEIDYLHKLSYLSKETSYVHRLLKCKRYSESSIRHKLSLKKLDSENISFIITFFKETGDIDDERYKIELINYLTLKNYGVNKISARLEKEGLDITLLYKERKEELKKAKSHLNKLNRKYDKYSHSNKIRHISSSLYSLGFTNSVIQEALTNVNEYNQEEEYLNLRRDLKIAILRHKKENDEHLYQNKIISLLLAKGYKINDILYIWRTCKDEINC